MPTGDAFTTMSTSAGITSAATVAQPGNATCSFSASAAALPEIGSMTAIESTPASASAHAMALPAPPAPNNATRRPRRRCALALDAAHEPRAVEHVAGPRPVRFAPQRVERADAIWPSGRDAGRSASMRALNGTVTSSPSRLRSCMSAGTISSNRSAGTCAGTSTASRPAAANRSVNTSGERTCTIGSPTIAYSRVAPVSLSAAVIARHSLRCACHCATRFDR